MIEVDERMYSTKDVAKLIGYSVRHVRALVDSGTLEATQINGNGQFRIYPDSIRKLLGVNHKKSNRSIDKKIRQEQEACAAVYGE